MITQQETAALCEMRSETEVPKQFVNIGNVVSWIDQEKKRARETTVNRAMGILREEAQHETTKTEEDSAYPRVKEQTSERRNEKSVLRASGTVTEPPVGTAREENS
ncbi:uncharacterized protein MONOS_7110 [Monocercomonoides exilis]|uniref:uncharacterized protein n=1 Tax=Monocercomonoides exilis TaxID=2049356 RepID=UPI003559BF9C|nr:hypothetical protein MONOS_7110 [Monocercomonoides exilis]|eukprot:MONOS_7110.1-p1 / transcript=MONOS_7110.1 / gene=MONOS_7110 / organism=Monocercomonoides_exilis_PA203 / gene_product=unspecified product / transcript_product=unspecified product / location=Mono_scaffold00236:39982-40299(-) / protein_length=106 / sequence_SO=supercontig / SO=protein_coding / is_pseudo=false